MAKKYHPIVTFKSTTNNFLHKSRSTQPKNSAALSEHLPTAASNTATDAYQTNEFVTRLESFKSAQPTRTAFETAIDPIFIPPK